MKIKVLSLFLLSPLCFSQNIIQTEIQGKKLNDFIQLENRLENKLFKTDENYVSVKPVFKPVIFERKEKDIPNLYFITAIKKIQPLLKFSMSGTSIILTKVKM